ncbi:hypothetical protein PPYR_13293 [Photinus pyralis]|uniref:Uncharacterized protein n=1 Tax=Photinus pyralis TaxID=7054 RepID=A0A5N4A8M8_PHOPY|nr:uncharacterized protein C2orf81 homolog [Photinus pyralis]KAB0793673.1 hypothetical protein PPYR_13293 [Photinus pyralis]
MSTPRRYSKEKRNSGRKSFTSGIGRLSEIEIQEMQKILERQEEDLVVYAVREELMTRVMNECYKSYIEKQSVKLMVHCAHRALVQLVNFGCFNHDPGSPFYENHPAWSADSPPRPSPVDNWAAGTIPVLPKPIPPLLPSSHSENDLDKSVVMVDTRSNIFGATPSSSPKLEVLYYNATTADTPQETTEVPDYTTSTDLLVPHVSQVSNTEGETTLHLKQELSIFTLTTEMGPETLPHSTKSGRSKLKGLDFRSEPHRQFKGALRGTLVPKLTPDQYSSLRKEMKCRKVKTPSDMEESEEQKMM